jgi:hypothetical protein
MFGKGSRPLEAPAGVTGPFPDRDLLAEVPSNELLIKNERIMRRTEVWDPQVALGHRRQKYRSAFDGHTSRDFSPDNEQFPRGAVFASAEYDEIRSLFLAPWILYARPLDRLGLRFPLDSCQVLEERPVVDGRRCLAIRNWVTVDRTRGFAEVWVDPEREYVPLRYFGGEGRTVRALVKVSYRMDPVAGWLPQEWFGAFYGTDGRATESEQGWLIRCHINEPIEDQEMSLEFPPGTWVYDHRRSKEYLVREGGGERDITPEEAARRPTYAELLATESGQAGLPHSGARLVWLIACAAGAAVLWAVARTVMQARRLKFR